MLKNFFTKLQKKALLSLMFLIGAFSVSQAQLLDYLAPYDCLNYTVSETSLMDSDSDYVYETYGVRVCGDLEVQTFPIQAIGDISRWPPLGIPTRSIVFDNAESVSFLETYYSTSGSIIGWFQKSADNDTVYFHDNGEDYQTINYAFDSSSYYLQAFPNPADHILNIHYTVSESQQIEIQLLDFEGNVLEYILNTPSGQGEYMMVWPVAHLANGYYRIRFISGSNNYIITLAVIH